MTLRRPSSLTAMKVSYPDQVRCFTVSSGSRRTGASRRDYQEILLQQSSEGHYNQEYWSGLDGSVDPANLGQENAYG